jgi:hypothetical protein
MYITIINFKQHPINRINIVRQQPLLRILDIHWSN